MTRYVCLRTENDLEKHLPTASIFERVSCRCCYLLLILAAAISTVGPRQDRLHPPSASLRGGGEGGGGAGGRGGGKGGRSAQETDVWVWQSGDHRLDVCGPSHSRKKLAQGRPDFFALLYSPPRAFYALDTFYVPNAVFSQYILVWCYFPLS